MNVFLLAMLILLLLVNFFAVLITSIAIDTTYKFSDSFVNFFLILSTGLTFAFTLASNFPQWLSNVMTAVIIVEFVYMLFIYGKVIPGYLSSGEVVPKTKDTIKID